jgi:hypothetical protein
VVVERFRLDPDGRNLSCEGSNFAGLTDQRRVCEPDGWRM